MTNTERYKQFMELYLAEDFNTLRTMLHPEVESENFAPANTPITGNRKGVESFMDYLVASGSFSCEIEFLESYTWFESGEHVVALGRERYLVKPTGKIVETAFAHETKWKDGKLIFWREYFDSAQMQAAYDVGA